MRINPFINDCVLDYGGAERLALDLHKALHIRGGDAQLIVLETSKTDGLEVCLRFATPYDPRVDLVLGQRLGALFRAGHVLYAYLFPENAQVATLKDS